MKTCSRTSTLQGQRRRACGTDRWRVQSVSLRRRSQASISALASGLLSAQLGENMQPTSCTTEGRAIRARAMASARPMRQPADSAVYPQADHGPASIGSGFSPIHVSGAAVMAARLRPSIVATVWEYSRVLFGLSLSRRFVVSDRKSGSTLAHIGSASRMIPRKRRESLPLR